MHNPYCPPASDLSAPHLARPGEARQLLLLSGVLVSMFIMFYVGRTGPTAYLTSSPVYVRPREQLR